MQNLDLYDSDRISMNSILSDKHIYAALKLLKKQFPSVCGLQPTILCQNYGFCSISNEDRFIYSYVCVCVCVCVCVLCVCVYSCVIIVTFLMQYLSKSVLLVKHIGSLLLILVEK